jgi:hypothetical protein
MRILLVLAVVFTSFLAQAKEIDTKEVSEKAAIETVQFLINEPDADVYDILRFMDYYEESEFRKSIRIVAKEGASDRIHYSYSGEYYIVDCYVSAMYPRRNQCSTFKR